MMYQVEFVKDGRRFATPTITETQKDVFIQGLGLKEDEYTVLERPDKKWHCVKVVFDMQKIEDGLTAVANGTDGDKNWIYTFGDPTEEANVMDAVKVQCTNGDIRTAFVVGVWLATADEIKAFKLKIGYKKLGVVIKKIIKKIKGGK